ncbi:hypothetical protein Agabi119p4_3705 [Agaricus bisporus var. burnettii]|uniref:F-box domain-containing protein n=1 Tax=Agaricus bisporus var. burnettii TaxID=192524 RepID=A0A8H7F593_AGABI|nr:hypothetical protein Agabi119p4_3705 [Agaricus bisporus var. burnettii]
MSNFEDLPDDVFLEISKSLLPQKENLCNLRLVSRRLSKLVSHLLFHRLVIRTGKETRQGATTLAESSIISVIASGSTTVFEHTKELKILVYSFDPPPPFYLRSFSNLTEFSGSWFCKAPSHTISEIASLLPRCPNLTRLRLGNVFNSGTTLNDIFFETGMMEKSLELKELQLQGFVVSPDAFEHYVRHFKCLTSLAITQNRSRSASTDFGEICNILRRNNIYLEHIVADHPEDLPLLSYLSSYSGLTRLTLESQSGGTGSFEAVNMFYTQVLPKQAEVLEELRLCFHDAPRVWRKTPTVNQLAGLTQCHKLRTLVVSSLFTFEFKEEDARRIWEFWFEVGLQLPGLEHMSVIPVNPYTWHGEFYTSVAWRAIRNDVLEQYQKEKNLRFAVN